MEELNLSKIFFLFGYFLLFSLIPSFFSKKSSTNIIAVDFVFVLAYCHFFYGAFVRYCGLQRDYGPLEKMSLFTENGGINTETLYGYW
mmetsp:Transcript_29426/g.44541  ORF Transcript_29426/g.44541 Transcript_29426/m.44541 type:complete len:88 (+) Transcript_29426:1193-1456(+)